MATLLTCRGIAKTYGTRTLFADLSMSFADEERVGLLGPNGAGKTTLLKILADAEHADGGLVERRRSAQIALVPQDDRFPSGATVESVLIEALRDEHVPTQDLETQVNIAVSRFGFERRSAAVEELSGGWRKRLALARAMVRQPELLLMDEPTNHLDIAGIVWLEELLNRAPFAFIVVSHDRYFLERVTNRVVELNPAYPDGYLSVSGAYHVFLEKREDFLESQQSREITLANIVRRENAFLKSHAKARRSKAKYRIDEAYRLKDELRDLKQRNAETSVAGIDFNSSGRKSKKLLEAKGLAKAWGDAPIFKDVAVSLSPGTRLGLLGANGSGKTTLIKVLTGVLPADAGTIERADGLRVVVFDQAREQLQQDLSLRRALSPESDTVVFRDRPSHITAWAKRFLFRTEQLELPLRELSGGEQARVLIARLMLQPADVLVLDEPTNDLDIASLDVLEESLLEFPGAMVLVTHDRFMLDRVCTEVLGLEGDGTVGRFANREQWQTAQQRRAAGRAADDDDEKTKPSKPGPAKPRMSASEQKELQDMEDTIHAAEADAEQRRQDADDPAIAADHVELQKRWDELAAARRHVEALYARWEVLEAKAAES